MRRVLWTAWGAFLATSLGMLVLVGCGEDRQRLEQLRDLQQRGRFEATLSPLRERLDEKPDDPELNHLYGLALLRSGQAGVAVWPLRKAADAPGREVEDGLLLAQALLSGGSAHDAIAAATRVLAVAPDNVDALRFRIAARIQQSQNEEALADTELLLARSPDDLPALLDRISALLRLERVDEAEEALKAARASAEKDPDSEWRPQLCAAAATFASEKGDPKAARAQWELCVEQFPAQPTLVLDAVAFFDEAGDRARSMEILRRAQETAPGQLTLRVSLAGRLELAGSGEEAEQLLVAATVENPHSFPAWMAIAGFYEARENYSQAATAMRQAFEQVASPPPILQARFADLLIRDGELATAEGVIRGLGDQPAMAKMLTGRLLLARGEPQAALEALDAGLLLWPGNAAARWLAGQAAERTGDYDRASREYIEAVRADHGNRDALLALLRLHAAQGSQEDLLPILGRYRKEKPNDPTGWVQSIRFAGGAGRPELAAKLATQLSQLPGQSGLAAAELASALSELDGPDAAVRVIEGTQLDLTLPRNSPALGALVANLGALGRHDEAIALADAAVASEGPVASFYEIRARALHRADRPDGQVREALERALAQNPEQPSALLLAGTLATQRGDGEAALAFYDRAAAADASDPDPKWRAIELLVESDRAAEIEARLEAMLDQHGDHAGPANLRAQMLLERGDLETALRMAKQAVRFRGGATALDTLGSVWLARGEGGAAADALRRSLELRPDALSTKLRYGRALLLTGETQGAREALTAALEADQGRGEPLSEVEIETARSELARMAPKP